MLCPDTILRGRDPSHPQRAGAGAKPPLHLKQRLLSHVSLCPGRDVYGYSEKPTSRSLW